MSDAVRSAPGPDAYQARKGLVAFTLEYTKWLDVFTKREVGMMLLQAMTTQDPEVRRQWLAYAAEWSKSEEKI